ncbi:hypothetical protein DFH27DRAFT_542122 [Peziza echinospora]|nr:hypothetical protein DFH27DRAFT_542122 [Peziza echinospora]
MFLLSFFWSFLLQLAMGLPFSLFCAYHDHDQCVLCVSVCVCYVSFSFSFSFFFFV